LDNDYRHLIHEATISAGDPIVETVVLAREITNDFMVEYSRRLGEFTPDNEGGTETREQITRIFANLAFCLRLRQRPRPFIQVSDKGDQAGQQQRRQTPRRIALAVDGKTRTDEKHNISR
jgi:hypothetical protein